MSLDLKPYFPRIYAITSAANAKQALLAGYLGKAVALGFDHVSIEAAAVHAPAQIAHLLSGCQQHNIRLLLQITLDELDITDAFYQEHHHLFNEPNNSDTLPDPRKPTAAPSKRRIKPALLERDRSWLSLWQSRLAEWLQAGVTGFIFEQSERLPQAAFTGLLKKTRIHFPAGRFIAWPANASSTATISPQLDALIVPVVAPVSAAIFSDGKMPGHYNKPSPLRTRSAPTLIAVPSIDTGLYGRDLQAISRATVQALQLACYSGNGWLLLPGMEYGQSSTHFSHNLALQQIIGAGEPELLEAIRHTNQRMAGYALHHGYALPEWLAERDGIICLLTKNAMSDQTTLVTINNHVSQQKTLPVSFIAKKLYSAGLAFASDIQSSLHTTSGLMFSPAELREFRLEQEKPMTTKPALTSREMLLNTQRIVIEAITPTVDNGRFAVKRSLGDHVTIQADILMDTHDKLAASVSWREADGQTWQSVPMQFVNNDRWQAHFPLHRLGRYLFVIEAWYDRFGTYCDGLAKKIAAGVDISLEIEEGSILLNQTLPVKTGKQASKKTGHAASLANILKALATPDAASLNHQEFMPSAVLLSVLGPYADTQRAALAILLAEHTRSTMQALDRREFLARSQEFPLLAERPAATFSSWYELFPRSQSGTTDRHGNFDDVIARLPAIQAMGFDTLYFPPIHPIGQKNRKGRNNALTANADDPGSPYAIGSAQGGHDAIHPELGGWDDFRRMRDAAAAHGLEIALDFAIQCAPDHPWLKQHPDWFDWRPDGSMKYAENPPKKYQDIVNVDFYAPQSIPDLWLALRDIVLLWVREGVRTFRVDNPHTKPLPFWEWLIRQVQDQYPDTIFLAEAFTTPKMMNRLAKLGFTQSYTYFTWRNSKQELTEYLTELNSGECVEFFRPHFFVNTPDIHPFYLQNSGRACYLVRAVLAATLSGLWGISSGFELCEADALPGREEFNNSEKYEIRAWDWQRPGNIVSEISLLNRLRKSYPALQSHLGVTFHQADNGQVLLYSKIDTALLDTTLSIKLPNELILVVVNLDPFATQEATLEIPLYKLGLPDDATVQVHDLVNHTHFSWQGKWQHTSLNPQLLPFAIWLIKAEGN